MAVYLSKVKAEGYGCSAFDAKINGTAYTNSVKCSSGRVSSPSKAVWLIDRKALILINGEIKVGSRLRFNKFGFLRTRLSHSKLSTPNLKPKEAICP